MTAERPEIRIGDRERRATDDRLRAALDDGVLTLIEYDERARQCFEARVQRELDVLVADLPDPEPAPTATPASGEQRPVPAARPPLRERLGKLVVPIVLAAAAVFVGGHVVTSDDGAAVFGSRTVTAAHGDRQVEVATLYGRTRVVVPPGSVARTTGIMIFGSTRCDHACQPPPGGATLPEVVVDANGAFGSVEVVTPAEAAQGGLRDRDDEDDD